MMCRVVFDDELYTARTEIAYAVEKDDGVCCIAKVNHDDTKVLFKQREIDK